MKPSKNPFAPGAGMPPPELAGRDALLSEARLTIQRNRNGNSARSFIYVGLCGVGKTVLLNEVQAIAEAECAITDFVEVSANERLSDTQKEYLRAMAELGPGPHRSGHIAQLLGKSTSQLGTTREGLINNGMIYSSKYGQAAFTVPLFDEFMKRIQPEFTPKSNP